MCSFTKRVKFRNKSTSATMVSPHLGKCGDGHCCQKGSVKQAEKESGNDIMRRMVERTRTTFLVGGRMGWK